MILLFLLSFSILPTILGFLEIFLVEKIFNINMKYIKLLKFLEIFYVILTISSKKSPTSISRGWIAFFIFLKLFQKYDIIKPLKRNKKEYFWSRSFIVLSVGGASKEEEMKIVKKAYKFRIYPTLEQVIFFSKNFGYVRKVYNLMLDDRKKGYEKYKSTGIKTKYPTPAKYKEEYPYLKEVDSLALANAQLNLEKAFKNFLKNKDFGFPRYKCKSNPVQSYTTNNQNTIYIKDSYIKLPKLKSLVKIKLHREIKGTIKSVTISKNSLNHYFASILCEEEIEELAKSISDVSWSEFVRQLEYKANRYGRKIVKVPIFYPSSKTCSSCGNIKETLTLSERIYHCECCGVEIDRDYNASINILRKGLEILKEEKVS